MFIKAFGEFKPLTRFLGTIKETLRSVGRQIISRDKASFVAEWGKGRGSTYFKRKEGKLNVVAAMCGDFLIPRGGQKRGSWLFLSGRGMQRFSSDRDQQHRLGRSDNWIILRIAILVTNKRKERGQQNNKCKFSSFFLA